MNFIYDRKKTAIIYKDNEHSYYELIKMAKLFSSKINVNSADRIILFMENRPEFLAALLGVWDSKAISTNLDAGYDEKQLEYVINDSNPKYIFVSNETLRVAKNAKKILNSDVIILNIDEFDFSEDISFDNASIKIENIKDTAVMLYTSGTTGNPKGVMLTFDNLMSNIDAIEKIGFLTPDDSFLAMLPFHHVLPLVATLLLPIKFGCTIVILDELSSDSIKKTLQKHKVNIIVGVPRIWEMFHKGIMAQIKSNKIAQKLFKICKALNNKFISKLIFKKVHQGFGGEVKLLISGGAKLDEEICADFNTLGLIMIEGYGLTETSPIIAFNKPAAPKAGTVGEPLDGIEVKIKSDSEIVVKGRNVMKGYFNKPEETAAAFDEDGWFHTGDLGEFDGKHLRIIGRKKEMIVLSNGKNINPSDIEAEIMKKTDLIQEAAVLEHEKHLVVIIYPNFKNIETRKIINIKEAIKWEVIDKYNATAHAYCRILDIFVVKDELPKTKLGKLRRFMLKDILLGADTSGNVSTPEKKVSQSKEVNSLEFKHISKFINELNGDTHIIPESHLEIDLGLDSLDKIEIISFVNSTFSVPLEEDDFMKIKTVEDLCMFIREKGGNFEEAEDVNWQNILSQPVELDIPKSTFVKFIVFLLKPLFMFRTKLIKNISKLDNTSPVLFIGNHQTLLDGFIITQLLPSNILKNTYFLAIKSQFNTPLKEYLANHGNIILIDINDNLQKSLQKASKVLKDGKNLVIFPEGARTRDGELLEFKKTFAILSKELNIPIIPFSINGAYELMPYGKAIPDSGKIKVEILDKIYPENLSINEIVSKTKNAIIKNLNN